MKVFVDTSVLVASVIAEHPHRPLATPVVSRIVKGHDSGFVSAHSLTEMYAVLTSLPVSPRIGPEAARKLVMENVCAHLKVVALTALEYRKLVDGLPEHAVAGGATYDAVHLACARKTNIDRIYTFNVSHFRRLAPDLKDIIVAP